MSSSSSFVVSENSVDVEDLDNVNVVKMTSLEEIDVKSNPLPSGSKATTKPSTSSPKPSGSKSFSLKVLPKMSSKCREVAVKKHKKRRQKVSIKSFL